MYRNHQTEAAGLTHLRQFSAQAYVSPSDEIMSPATQKLSAFRSKHAMKKYALLGDRDRKEGMLIEFRQKPQTLFARTSSKNFEAAKGAAMFADIPKDNKQSGEEGT